jgi:large subunit ribosomal protein L15
VNLHEVNGQVAKGLPRHRIGRGTGSGWGTTAGRGYNGALCRSGYKARWYREGGQMPMMRRIPKRGFNNKAFGNVWAFVNLYALNTFDEGTVITAELLLEKGLIPKVRSGLKVLGVGTLEKKLTVKATRVSASAKAAIEGKGGTIELLKAEGDESKRDWQKKRNQGKRTVRRNEATGRAAAAKGKKAPAGKPKK